MLVPEEFREENGPVRQFLDKLSTVHKDGYFPRSGEADPSTLLFRILVGAMGLCLLITMALGLWLAWKQSARKKWALLALGLGVVVPLAVLWLA
jgi:cytochrome bd-type quinol oxidase subunit 1